MDDACSRYIGCQGLNANEHIGHCRLGRIGITAVNNYYITVGTLAGQPDMLGTLCFAQSTIMHQFEMVPYTTGRSPMSPGASTLTLDLSFVCSDDLVTYSRRIMQDTTKFPNMSN